VTQPWNPHQPVGAPPPQRVDIESYRPPRNNGPVLWAVGAVVVLVAVVAAGLLSRSFERDPAPAPTPAASTPASAPQAPADDRGLPFTMPADPTSTGRWKILETQWYPDGVLLQVRVEALRGRVSYGFMAFARNGEEIIEPVASPRSPELSSGEVVAGEAATGYVFLPLPRGDGMLILTTSFGRQISALDITG